MINLMGLFSKHKSKEDYSDSQIPPMPPSPSMMSAPAPPMMSAPQQTYDPAGTLSAPPVPGGKLSDMNMASRIEPSSNKNINMGDSHSEDDFSSFGDDSLFDFSALSVDSPSKEEKNSARGEMNEESSNSDGNSNRHFGSIIEDRSKDRSMHDKHELSFLKRNMVAGSRKNFDTMFITTAQFKILLEVVEEVKDRVKEANETHLRLLDIKSEEDIEYENLRKDFQFMEDKLYELDAIIFEK